MHFLALLFYVILLPILGLLVLIAYMLLNLAFCYILALFKIKPAHLDSPNKIEKVIINVNNKWEGFKNILIKGVILLVLAFIGFITVEFDSIIEFVFSNKGFVNSFEGGLLIFIAIIFLGQINYFVVDFMYSTEVVSDFFKKRNV